MGRYHSTFRLPCTCAEVQEVRAGLAAAIGHAPVSRPERVGCAVGVGAMVVAVATGVAVTTFVAVGVLAGGAATVGAIVVGVTGAVVEVGPELVPLMVKRRSSSAWSLVLERMVRLVTGLVQPVVRVLGALALVVTLASGFRPRAGGPR